MNLKEAGSLLGTKLSANFTYYQAFEIIRKIASGKIWLVGSGVYKTLINIFYDAKFIDLSLNNFSSRNEAISGENCEWATKLYLEDKARSPEQFAAEIANCSRKDYLGTGLIIKDWDFVVEGTKDEYESVFISGGWSVNCNQHGNIKIDKDEIFCDIIPLFNIHSIKQRGLAPDIRHYISGVPFSVQALAFDVNSGELIGEDGLKSILSRTIWVNNQDELDYARDLYGDKYLIEIFASSLGFVKVDKLCITIFFVRKMVILSGG